tara:strand:- start:7772 stop:8374 length:603 start_codon:yes stop_codon:yes gene_type:complete
MISYYRLGDLVLLSLTPQEERKLLEHHPNTIGSAYILNRPKLAFNKIALITRIFFEYSEANRHLIPADIMNSVVIHLRLGDVVAGTTEHESGKRPHPVEYLQAQLKGCDDCAKRYLIGACFFAETSSTNVEECQVKSNLYLNAVLNETRAEHLNSGVADIDLCIGVLAKQFIQGKGYFSQLIVDIRKHLNLPSIECKTEN